VRLVFANARVVLDHARRAPGRGAYVHPRAACFEAAARGGLARSLRRAVPPGEIHRIAADLSPIGDNSRRPDETGEIDENVEKKPPGLDGAKAVETPSRTKAVTP